MYICVESHLRSIYSELGLYLDIVGSRLYLCVNFIILL
jgi:hypothetical protein